MININVVATSRESVLFVPSILQWVHLLYFSFFINNLIYYFWVSLTLRFLHYLTNKPTNQLGVALTLSTCSGFSTITSSTIFSIRLVSCTCRSPQLIHELSRIASRSPNMIKNLFSSFA